jgi:hypothetical protein
MGALSRDSVGFSPLDDDVDENLEFAVVALIPNRLSSGCVKIGRGTYRTPDFPRRLRLSQEVTQDAGTCFP